MQAGVCKADGLLGAAVVVALMLVAVAIYLVLMRKHARPVTAKLKVPALAPAAVHHFRAWT